MPWLELVLTLLGLLAFFIQQGRVTKWQKEAKWFQDLYRSAVDTNQLWQEARDEDVARLEALIEHRDQQLRDLEQVCRESDAPDAVRNRLRLLLDPTAPRAAAGQRSLPLDGATPHPKGASGGGGG